MDVAYSKYTGYTVSRYTSCNVVIYKPLSPVHDALRQRQHALAARHELLGLHNHGGVRRQHAPRRLGGGARIQREWQRVGGRRGAAAVGSIGVWQPRRVGRRVTRCQNGARSHGLREPPASHDYILLPWVNPSPRSWVATRRARAWRAAARAPVGACGRQAPLPLRGATLANGSPRG